MDLSIIIPTYNRVNLLKVTLDSLRQEHHAGMEYEVIVVDDHSDDNTVAIVKEEYPWVTIVLNDKKGASAARNQGLRLAKGFCVTYLDSDDLVEPGFYNEKVSYLKGNETTGACYGSYEYFSSDGNYDPSQNIFKHKYQTDQSLSNRDAHLLNYLSGSYMPQNAIVWKRSLIDRIGGHAEGLKINQDVDLVLKALLSGASITFINDDTHALIREHETDTRVGNHFNQEEKLQQLLALRKEVFQKLVAQKQDTEQNRKALSKFCFGFWRDTRKQYPKLSAEYLSFSKQLYWPLAVEGGAVFNIMGKVLGPVMAIKLKDTLVGK